MREVPVTISLEASDVPPTVVQGTLREFSGPDRAWRALAVLGGCVVLAAMLIPIPIIHLIGIPLLLITGVVLAIRQVGLAVRLTSVKIACPKCGGINSIGGGLGQGSVSQPMERMCENCRRPLTLRVTPSVPADLSGT